MLIDTIAEELSTIFNDFGETVTYEPGSPAPSFPLRGLFTSMQMDDPGRRLVRDVCECRILHADLNAQGLSAPVVRGQAQGDTIIKNGPDGTPATWAVVECSFELGVWILTLEKHVRIMT